MSYGAGHETQRLAFDRLFDLAVGCQRLTEDQSAFNRQRIQALIPAPHGLPQQEEAQVGEHQRARQGAAEIRPQRQVKRQQHRREDAVLALRGGEGVEAAHAGDR